jgi:hypothetical protein
MTELGRVIIPPVPQVGYQAHKSFPVIAQRHRDFNTAERFPRHRITQLTVQFGRERIVFNSLKVDKLSENLYKGYEHPL